ncbi:MAG: DUF3081 domain-containing protein [Gammaproteobacteria bacterium]|nr:DUF3081 domain-containing protein [Gammaproteobacteria bacterium]MBT8151191.1 DUF3081 domain-containing protein [Gammaproteobacteria bacterium]NNM11406.1 DUF3081 family protein [Pseudomonadales bacterium]RZV54738.1 MAG: DUF3081 family protein [Pseudomonadales bacterium]
MIDVVNIKTALNAFHVIREKGEKTSTGYVYKGITADTDFDGYTIYLKADYVTLTIYFHNKFDVDYANMKELTMFLEKLLSITKS